MKQPDLETAIKGLKTEDLSNGKEVRVNVLPRGGSNPSSISVIYRYDFLVTKSISHVEEHAVYDSVREIEEEGLVNALSLLKSKLGEGYSLTEKNRGSYQTTAIISRELHNTREEEQLVETQRKYFLHQTGTTEEDWGREGLEPYLNPQ